MTLALLLTAGAFGMTMALTESPPSTRPGNVVQLTSGPYEHVEPAYSPDGKFIAFSSNQEGGFDIWVMKEDGRQLTRITSLPGDEVTPRWNPIGGTIAFVWNHGQYSDLCIASMASDHPECVTNGSRVRTFSWSPDGLAIAYDCSNGTIRFHNMTSGQEAPFPFAGHVGDPAFGPKAGALYFSLRTSTGDYIWNASVDGRNGRQLSWEGSDVKPQVSPAGNYLMYLTNLSGRCEPWLIDLVTGVNSYLFSRPEPGLSYTFPSPPLLAGGTVPSWGPKGNNALFISDDNGSEGTLYLVTLDITVNLGQAPYPQDLIFVLNVYNRIPFGAPVSGAQWSPTGNVVVGTVGSGFDQLVLLQNGPPVRVGYGG